MNLEKSYTQKMDEKHLKSFGQFFTPYEIAEFMSSWACKGAKKVLDPAAGNSIFLRYARACNPSCTLHGYEIDLNILDFFGNPANADLKNEDFLLSDWEETYDAIICNPPYHRFQDIANRKEILSSIREHTGCTYSSYTNLYILFLLKCLYQLTPTGRLTFLIPTEFLNSRYGTAIKEKLIREKLLYAIINFENDTNLFFHATTTCCILLIDHSKKDSVLFYNLSSAEELYDLENRTSSVTYDVLQPQKKWRSYLKQEDVLAYSNLVPLSSFCRISRGIATGANDYFCFSNSKIHTFQLEKARFTRCICRSADIKGHVITNEVWEALARQDKAVYVLDLLKDQTFSEEVTSYLALGEEQGIPQKHLPAHRHPWYLMEQRQVAPIWVTNASREKMKFVRNLAGIHSLTTFHSVYILEAYATYTDIIFAYFLTETAQKILKKNRKELGNGLEKFQPSDLTTALMLDVTLISEADKTTILNLYQELLALSDTSSEYDMKISLLNKIFFSYMA